MFMRYNNLYLFKGINCLQSVYMWLTVPHNNSEVKKKKKNYNLWCPIFDDKIEALKIPMVSKSKAQIYPQTLWILSLIILSPKFYDLFPLCSNERKSFIFEMQFPICKNICLCYK